MSKCLSRLAEGTYKNENFILLLDKEGLKLHFFSRSKSNYKSYGKIPKPFETLRNTFIISKHKQKYRNTSKHTESYRYIAKHTKIRRNMSKRTESRQCLRVKKLESIVNNSVLK